MPTKNLIIAWFTGSVGKELLRQIDTYDVSSNDSMHTTRIVGISNGQWYMIDANWVEEAPCMTRDHLMNSAQKYMTNNKMIEVYEASKDAWITNVIVVDVSADGSREMLEWHKHIIADGWRIVTANKNPISLFSTEDFRMLTSDRGRYGYGATVMAGGDAVKFVCDSCDIWEDFSSLEWCFSWTLGYICSQLDSGDKTFSEIVREAHNLGYTEPNPYDDLNGLDVARKLLILARCAGHDIVLDNIMLEWMVWDEFASCTSTDDFLEKISWLDTSFAERVSQARERWMVCRYVAEMQRTEGKYTFSAWLKEVPSDSQIGQLQWATNLLKVVSSLRAPENMPHFIVTQGAGLERTAATIRANLLAM